MFKHSIAATLNTQRPDKNGNYPVRIRVTIKRVVTYYPTGVMVKIDQWNKDRREVEKHSDKSGLNQIIRDEISKLEKALKDQAISGDHSTRVKNQKDLLFSNFAESKIKLAKGKESPGTLRHKKSYLKKFSDFRPTIKISQIDSSVLIRYEQYCRGLGNKNNTVVSSVKFVLTIINAAVREGLVSSNPAAGYKRLPYKDPERDWLTDNEISRLEKFVKENKVKSYTEAANWFLFACYSGLRYGDIKDFAMAKVIGDKIILRTTKTGTDVSIKLHTRLRTVIDRMNYKVTSNQDYNRKLKAIALICKIDKPLTSHIARHTFAVQFLNGGGTMETLGKLLGHSSLKTTAIYGKITDTRIDEEMERVWGK